ncbi:hypothetical protein GP486_004704 [Trichoglossum hirsutum]|uniref:DUF1772-domain-containing protein n=1 Tax=Trichoglossum hirsutum TaxID=265104 RepID=A0A9P8RP76_9PEZI|nr:hypothetical protein GP486_004704 [Trichoglossum hirsutum]
MATSRISFRMAQAFGVVGAAWLSGNIAALSLISVPALSRSQAQDSVQPGILSKQWKYNYEAGKTQNPPVAVAVAASFSYLAWSVRSGTQLGRLAPAHSVQLFSTAAILTIGIIPYTIIAMRPTNNKLLAKAEQEFDLKGASASVTSDDREVGELLKKWTFLNGIRSLMPLLGSAAALLAA